MSDQLKTAERLIRDSETLVARQMQVIAELLREGQSVVEAHRLLRTAERTLARLREHHEFLKYRERTIAVSQGSRLH